MLVARALGLTVGELLTLYRVQFSLLRQYERDTYYDQFGRIVFLAGDRAYGLSRPEWIRVQALRSGSVERRLTDDTRSTGPFEKVISYQAPFDQCDREADYVTAWKFFDKAGV